MEITIMDLLIKIVLIAGISMFFILWSDITGRLLFMPAGKEWLDMTASEKSKVVIKGILLNLCLIIISCFIGYIGDWTITIPI